MSIYPQPKHAAVNRILAGHRLWLIGIPGNNMVAISPQVGTLEPGGTPEPNPDEGKDHLVFCAGDRWRSPTVDVRVATPDRLVVALAGWPPAAGGVEMIPLTITSAQQAGGFPDVDGMDPRNPEHQALFDGMFPR